MSAYEQSLYDGQLAATNPQERRIKPIVKRASKRAEAIIKGEIERLMDIGRTDEPVYVSG